jgi:hypothetical protein
MPRPSTSASTPLRTALGVALLLAAIAPALGAQWQVISLHPEAAFDSYALSVKDGHQAGYVRMPGTLLQHASLWSGTPDSWVDLHPDGATESQANGVSGGMQVGWACCFDPPSPGLPVRHAMLWSGTAASWSDLEPDGAFGEAAGLSLYVQCAIKDAGAVHGVALSNALRGDVP